MLRRAFMKLMGATPLLPLLPLPESVAKDIVEDGCDDGPIMEVWESAYKGDLVDAVAAEEWKGLVDLQQCRLDRHWYSVVYYVCIPPGCIGHGYPAWDGFYYGFKHDCPFDLYEKLFWMRRALHRRLETKYPKTYYTGPVNTIVSEVCKRGLTDTKYTIVNWDDSMRWE
ncbi:hypothetical protein LCGC14_0248630 [marine sediment metagenome]|uniref:Uncharacterized protein n=1 Tax=marine sediment metagenome TaxID=412755 RepID=A0A0F9WQ53_9ZZZZ